MLKRDEESNTSRDKLCPDVSCDEGIGREGGMRGAEQLVLGWTGRTCFADVKGGREGEKYHLCWC